MIDVLPDICNKIWRTGEWTTPWTQSLINTLPKKGNLQLCHRTNILISNSSKVMLKVIFNKLKPKPKRKFAEFLRFSGLTKTILQGIVKGKRRSSQRKK